MWQICGYIPQTIMPLQPDITQKAAQLSTSFFIETFIHAKEKVIDSIWKAKITYGIYIKMILADNGAVGRTSHKAVQCLSGGQRLVLRTHGQRHLVACAGAAQVP